MVHDSWVRTCCYLLSTVFLLEYFGDWQRLTYARRIDDPVLKVREELWEESMPLRGGSRIYKLEGLKPYTRYEVKISYPASIPAHFSVQLLKRDAEFGASSNRKLLNTEKLIFRTDGLKSLQNQGTMHVMVTVEPKGVVAIREVNERQSIIFNIGQGFVVIHAAEVYSINVCDELLMGMISLEAWWIVGCVLLCLVVAFIIPSFLPSFLLPKRPTPDSLQGDVSKSS